MLLAIDCGNTNTVISLFEGLDKVASWRMATDAKQTADDNAVWLDHHMRRDGIDAGGIDGAVISSVVPACLPALVGFAERLAGAAPLVIDSADASHGVEIRIDRPGEAGADRVANTAAAAEYGLPALVIDFGTATTFDIIDADGAYAGGVIAPGVALSVEALHGATAQLPLVDPASWSAAMPVMGRNTLDAMNAGLFYGYVGLVEGIVARLEAELGGGMTVIATGGLAGGFAPAIAAVDHHDPDLTLKGMVRIHRRWSGEAGDG